MPASERPGRLLRDTIEAHEALAIQLEDTDETVVLLYRCLQQASKALHQPMPVNREHHGNIWVAIGRFNSRENKTYTEGR